MNLASDFYRICEQLPEKTFLRDERERSYRYGEIRERVARLRIVLRHRLGIRRGERVLLSFKGGIEFVCAYLAVLSEGGVAVLVDPFSTSTHIRYVMENAGIRRALCSDDHPTLSHDDRAYILADVDALEAENGAAALDPAVASHAEDLALLIYTSGTTGTPKGVCLSHANLLYSRDAIREWAGISGSDRELTTLSLNHLFGLAHLHIYWSVGASLRIHDGFRNVPAILEALRREGITSFPGTPAGFRMLLDRFAGPLSEHGASLRYIVINSAPLEPEYVRRLMEALPHVRIYMYYGLTEASRATYICYNDHPQKLATVGRPHPPTEVRIGEESEIQVRGPHVTRGYWGLDSKEYFADGWFRTGDVGDLDADGFLTWRGRLKEQINVDGLKVTPGEIEAVLADHPSVREVAAFAMPDAYTGEAVACAVVPNAEADGRLELELRKFCRTRLPTYQIPRRVLIVDEIPKTDSGKVKRLELRDRLGP